MDPDTEALSHWLRGVQPVVPADAALRRITGARANARDALAAVASGPLFDTEPAQLGQVLETLADAGRE